MTGRALGGKPNRSSQFAAETGEKGTHMRIVFAAMSSAAVALAGLVSILVSESAGNDEAKDGEREIGVGAVGQNEDDDEQASEDHRCCAYLGTKANVSFVDARPSPQNPTYEEDCRKRENHDDERGNPIGEFSSVLLGNKHVRCLADRWGTGVDLARWTKSSCRG